MIRVFVMFTDGKSATFEAGDAGIKDGFLNIELEEDSKFISINMNSIKFFRTDIKDG